MDSEQGDSSCFFIWSKISFKVCCTTYWKQYPQQKVCRKPHNQLLSSTSLLLDHHHELCFLPSFSSYLWVCETFLFSCGLQWICWVKQGAGIPQNSSTHPESLLAVLLPWRLGNTMPCSFLQLNWRCAWQYSLSCVISQHHCFFSCLSFPLSPMVHILSLDAAQSLIL